MTALTLWRHARLATMAGAEPWGEIADGALLVEGDRLHWVGRDGAWPNDGRIEAGHDLGGALVTPGLIDCHTHLVYGGHRAREFELRLQGASYEDIARAGGGIRSTVAATRRADDDTLFAAARERALALMTEGVDVHAVLQAQRTATLRSLQDLTRLKASADEVADAAWLLVLEAMLFQGEAEIRWLDHCEARVSAMPLRHSAPTTAPDREEVTS